MSRPSCLTLLGCAGLLAVSACAPAIVPAAAPAPRLLLADATPAPADSASPPAPASASSAASAAPAPSSTPPPSPDQAAHEREDRQLGRTWGWTAVSIGAAAGALAIGTSILMLEDNSTRNSDCNSHKVCNSSGVTANGQLGDLGPWNAGFWVIGVAGLGIGAYLLVTHPTDKASGTQVGIAPNGSGASFQLKGSF